MWLFNLNRKGPQKLSKPVQRQISIRTRDEQEEDDGGGGGYSYESNNIAQRSPQSRQNSSFLSSSQINEDVEDEESETSCSSDGNSSGRKQDRRSAQNSSYHREPLDTRLWSNVTSPGFTTRAVQQANGTAGGLSPLREKMTNRSPFSRSPNGQLKVGQLPITAVPRRSGSSLASFPTPRSLFTYGRFSRINKRDGKNGTVFVKLAPVDVSRSAPSVTPSTPSPSGMNLSPNQMSMSSFNEPTSPGLGGIPQSGLTHRFSRLWPNPNSPQSMQPGYQSFQNPGPSNLADVLANRKRGRDVEIGSDGNKIIRQQGSPSTPHIDEANKYPKRVKFVNDQEMRLNRPLAFDSYHEPSSSGGQPMTSILEQMNQTEKRFLPDASLTSIAKKSKMMSSPPRGSTTSGMRKRRGNNGISMVEDEEDDDDPKSKTGKFCHCNECYREAAGLTCYTPVTPVKTPVTSPPESIRKSVTFDDTTIERQNEKDKEKQIQIEEEREFEKSLISKPEVEVIIRKANRSSSYITKDKYEDDRIRRLERFRRILGLKKPEPSKDQIDGQKPAVSTSVNVQPVTPVSFTTLTPISFPSSVISPSDNSAPDANILKTAGESQLSSQPETQQKADTEKDLVPKSTLDFSVATTDASSLGANTQTTNSFSFGSVGQNTAISTNSNQPSTATPAYGTSNFGGSLPNSGGFAFGQQQAQPAMAPLSSQPETQQKADTEKDLVPKSTLDFSVATTDASSLGANTQTTNGFSFGSVGQNTTVSTNSNQTSTATPAFGTSSFGGSSLPSSTSTGNAFSFGNSLPNSGGFAFGQQQAKPAMAQLSSQPETQQKADTEKDLVPKSTLDFSVATTDASSLGANTQTTNGFSFGSASHNTSASTNSNQPSTATPAFGTSSFGGSSVPSSTSTGNAFSFGGSVPNSGGFAFGQTQAKPAVTAAASLFGTSSGTTQSTNGFGSLGQNTAVSTNANQPSPATPAFGTTNFGGSSVPSSTSTGNAFNFGGSTPNSGGFAFGQTQAKPAVTAAASPFGAVSGSAQSTNGFGSMGQNPSASMNSNQPSTATPAFGTTNFGGSSVPSSTSTGNAFSFGNSMSNSGGFAFGQPQTQTTTTNQSGGFNFGQISSPQSSDTSKDQSQGKISFGASSNTNQAGLFGSVATANQASPFGATSTSNQSSLFGASTTTPSPFGAVSGNTQATNGFSFGSASQNTSASTNSNQPSTATPAFGTSNFGASSGTSSISSTSTGNAFNFGGSLPNSGGFAFGQQQAQPAMAAASPQPGVFNFGQVAPPQSSPGGFNFSAQAQPPPPAYGANLPGAPGMFNLGTPVAAAPRSRTTRLRKYR